MSMIVRGLAATTLAVAMGFAFATPASAEPLIDACASDDNHVTVEVLNTEVAQVCWQK